MRGPAFMNSLLACELSSICTGLLYLARSMGDRKGERAFCELPITGGPHIFGFRPGRLREAGLRLALPAPPSVPGRCTTKTESRMGFRYEGSADVLAIKRPEAASRGPRAAMSCGRKVAAAAMPGS